MKRNILIILFLLLLASCIVYIYKNNTKILNDNIVEETKNYKVIVSENEKTTEYHYWIFDNSGNIIHEDIYYKNPNISYLSSDIIQKHTGGGNVSQYQFFNIEKGLISPIYDNPGLIDNGKIVYMAFENDQIKLIVRDLFDESIFYKEYECNFSPVAAASSGLITANFINSSELQVTYLSGEDFMEVTEVFDLTQE